jgi:hypothetical protein
MVDSAVMDMNSDNDREISIYHVLVFCDQRGVGCFCQSRKEAHHEQAQLDWVRDVDAGVPLSSLISRRNGAAPWNRHVESKVV